MIGCRRAAFEGSKSNSSVWTIAWVPHAGCPCPWFCFSRVGGWDTELKKYPKMHLFKATVKSILLYGADSWSLTKSLEKRLHGMYTGILRKVQNIYWKDKVTNNFVYSSNPCLTEIIRRKRLSLAGHVSRPNEPAGSVLLWEPNERRRVGRPKITLKKILEDDTGLEAHELQTVMLDRVSWGKNLVISPIFSDAVKLSSSLCN